MAEDKKQPGVMIYFEARNCLKRLDLEETGRLFLAILDYSEYRNEPDFSEENELALCVAWDVIKPKIDADLLRYQEKCEKNRKAAQARWEE